MPVHKINVQLQMASVGKPQVVDSTPVWYLLITESKINEACYHDITVSVCYVSDLKQVLCLSAWHCPSAHSA